MLREAVTVNGITDLAINKLDILSGFGEIRVATEYEIDGKRTRHFPMTLDELERAQPVYQGYPGWDEDVSSARRVEDLPENARRYVEAIEQMVGVQAALLSVGPGRDETIARSDPLAR
jgi:adenylosuccinate synthase